VIVLSLFPRLGLREVYARLLRAWRWLGELVQGGLPSAGALCYRRGTLGIGVLRCLSLAEVGTHAIVDAVAAPCRVSDHRLLPALLPSVQADRLVLLDRGVFSGPVLAALRARQAHGLARLEAGMLTRSLRRLCDGSYLVELTPATSRGLSEPLLLRVIEYTLDPPLAQQLKQLAHSTPSRPCDPTQVHRLVTTVLDPQPYPARALILCSHERWEIELWVDELKTHLRLSPHPLRSRTPLGVLQELSGLLLLPYAGRSCMATSAAQADLDPDRLSFTPAVHVLGDALLLPSRVSGNRCWLTCATQPPCFPLAACASTPEETPSFYLLMHTFLGLHKQIRSKNAMLIWKIFRHFLTHFPLLDHLVVLEAKDVDQRDPRATRREPNSPVNCHQLSVFKSAHGLKFLIRKFGCTFFHPG
jgi:Transposase DDE domain